VAGVTSRCAFNAWGEEPDQRGKHSAVDPVHSRPGVGPAQDRILVTQDEDLDVLGCAAAGEQSQPFGGTAKREVEQA
jgi:hypothetical protein